MRQDLLLNLKAPMTTRLMRAPEVLQTLCFCITPLMCMGGVVGRGRTLTEKETALFANLFSYANYIWLGHIQFQISLPSYVL